MKKILSNKEILALSGKISLMNEELKKSFSGLEKQVRKKLKEVIFLKKYSERVLMSVPDPIIIFGEDLKIEYVNSAFDDLVKADTASFVGKTLEEVDLEFKVQWEPVIEGLREYSQGTEADGAEKSLPKYQPRDPLTPENISEAQRPRNIMHFGSRLFGYMFFDVAAEKEIDKRIGFLMREYTQERLLRDQLAENERLAGLGRLVSGIGHELSNPLFAILGYSESLMGQKDPEKIEKGVARILDRARHMSGIIKNFSGITEDGGNGDGEVDINEIVEFAIQKTFKAFPSDNIKLEKQLNDLPSIKAGFEELAKVFSNIILNALQAMDGVGTLTIISELVEGKVVVQLNDTGPGIPSEYLSKIFEPYFTTKAQGGGNGMGLNVAYRIVESYGGQIKVKSIESQGASFIVTF